MNEVERETSRQSALVPEIGESWARWYDYPYRAIEGLYRLWSWGHMPRPVRLLLSQFQSYLRLFNSYDREKISHPDDPRHNVVVPDGEQVDLPVLFVVEFYSPAYSRELRRSITSRSWPRDRHGSVPGDDLRDQLRRLRELNSGFNSQVGSFRDTKSEAWWIPNAKVERLPAGIEHVEVHLESLGPSLTALIAAFHLNPERMLALDRAAKAPHPPKLIRVNGKLHLYQKIFQGINDVQGERARLHQDAREWLAKKVPGIFAMENDRQLPVLDVILTHSHDPLGTERRLDNRNFLRALGLEGPSWNQVVSPDLPGFELLEYRPERLRKDDRAQWALVAKHASAFDDDRFKFNFNKSRTSRNIARAANSGAIFLLTRLAIMELLDLKSRQTSQSRDIANEVHSGHRPARSIKKLRRALLTNSIDLDAIAGDLIRLTATTWRYEFNVPTLWSQTGPAGKRDSGKGQRKKRKDSTNKTLLKDWADVQSRDIAELLEADRSLTALLGVVASLASSLSAIRAQRWSILVSIGSFVAAVAAIWLAWLALGSNP
ncbi:hypothetical protein [Cryobacterium arcticum]|uniref:Uncharacterized protein n=1 Tax=Cryobacterium arcticum TaxID=670052 RepID=A0A1B1BKJ6_9MICO|nr:hypothetical protein [Cryobacterium arcticum]ANP73036.1 hypothetical protein PA27867_2084 [Cryobacterium arcticum]